MKNFVTAMASALLVAVIVTSLYTLVFASAEPRPLTLFILSFLGMAAVALFNVRQAALRSGLAVAPAAPAAARSGNANSASGQSGNRSAGARDSAGRGGRGRNRNDRSGKPDRKGSDTGSGGKGAGKPAAGSATASDKAPAEPVVIPDGPRETGTVKWFNRSKGFGFIIRDNGEEIFVHHRSIRNSDDSRRSNLRDGQTVNYVVADHSKGQQAEDVVGE